MKKLSSILCIGLILVLFSSCAPDLTDDVEWAYDVAKNNSSGSCTTMEDGNMWSPMTSSTMDWDSAVSYCNNLTACGYSDWHLPTISELRTLIEYCDGTVTGGSCGVTDTCLSSSCWNDTCAGLSYYSSCHYNKLCDTGWFWSSSTISDETVGAAWCVNFYFGMVNGGHKTDFTINVRCVR